MRYYMHGEVLDDATAIDYSGATGHDYPAAEAAARHEYHARNGSTRDWPVLLTLVDDDGTETIWEVDVAFKPTFSARRYTGASDAPAGAEAPKRKRMTMTDTTGPRDAVIAHAQACREAVAAGRPRPEYTGPCLVGSDLHDADLTGADLRGAVLRGAVLHDADLTEAVLHDADLTGADLRGTDLRDADMRRAVLHGADLTEADMRRAVLHGAILTEAALTDADLRGQDCTIILRGMGVQV